MHGKHWVRVAISVSAAVMTAALAVNPSVINPKNTPPTRLAQITPVPAPAMTSSGAVPSATPMQRPAPSSATPAQNAQVWNLKNADIRAVIQTISILTGKNFIVDPRVQGNVTLISQKPMTPDEMYQVFLSMLQLLQFSAIPAGGVIKVVPAEEGAALTHQLATSAAPGVGEEIVVRVLPVKRVSATELVPVLRPLMPQTASITAYPPSNSLILAGTASNIQRLSQIVAQMDSANANEVQVVSLRYANAKKIVDMIQALHRGDSASGGNNPVLVPDEEDNSVLVNANATNQILVRQLIRQLDQPGAGGDDIKVVHLNYLTAKKVAPILSKIANGEINAATTGGKDTTGGGTNDVSVQAESDDNALIIHAPSAIMKSLQSVIRRLDSSPQEVLVEAIIVKVDENLLNKLGIEWGSPTGPLGSSMTNADGTTSEPSIQAVGDFAMKVGSSGVGLLPNGNMMALLHALKSDGTTDVLSTPSVVVLNNNKASISDGQNIGVANTSYQGTTSTPTTSGTSTNTTVVNQPYNAIQRQNVTLSLDVTPHVSPNSMIRMDLVQQDNTVAPSDNVQSQQQDNPTLNVSKIQTSVLVKSGDILVLGGLISSQQEKVVNKVPILGDIPLLGQLFTYKSHTMEKTSLMVFIRPIVMTKKTSKVETMGRYHYLRDQQIGVKTEKAADFTRMTILPKLGTQFKVSLPPPVNVQPALPLPNQTVNKS